MKITIFFMRKICIWCSVFILFCLIGSCSVNEKKMNGFMLDLSIYKNDVKFSEFVDSLSYIHLETNDSCLISGVEYLYVVDDDIFIKDIKGGGIFRFDISGKFISRINSFGSGPKEFNRIHNFCVDRKHKSIYIYDDLRRRIIQYDYNGVYLSDFKVDQALSDFCYIDENTFVFFRPHFSGEKHNGVWYTDKDGRFLSYILESKPDKSFSLTGAELCTKREGSVYYYDKYTDRIFNISKDSAQSVFNFDLKQKLPVELLKNPNAKQNDFFMNIAFIPTTKYFFLFYISDNDFRKVIYDRVSNRVQVSKFFVDDIDNNDYVDIITTYNDSTLIGIVKPDNEDLNPILQIIYLK